MLLLEIPGLPLALPGIMTSAIFVFYNGAVELPAQQIETHLEFSPDFLDAAKAMLRDFIERTEASRASGDGQSSRS